MTHVPEDVLAGLALGDPDLAQSDRDHVHACRSCSAELAALTRLRTTLGTADLSAPPDPAPDPGLWERIAAATATDPAEAEPRRLAAVAPAPPGAASQPPDQAGAPGPPADHEVAPTGKPRRPRPWPLLAAALVCVLAGLGIGWFAFAPDQESARLVASATLRTLDGSQTLGSAQLLDEAGSTGLRVSAIPGPAGTGYVEVWLINDDGKRMVSLGVLDAEEAVFAVPPGALAQGYRIVDLSREPYDDEPRHSGDSLMRGKLA
jgi:hypothetical protein